MNEHQIRALLAAAMAYDNRKPGDATVLAWTEAARRGRWTFDTALDAIHAHYAESPDFLMPGHITQRLRRAARRPAPYAALPPARVASDETRERVKAVVGTFAKRFSLGDTGRWNGYLEPELRPQRGSAEHTAAREAARRELNEVRRRAEQASPP